MHDFLERTGVRDPMSRPIVFDGNNLRIEDVVCLAKKQCQSTLVSSEAFRQQIDRGALLIDSLIQKGEVVYGVTTGYGENVSVQVSRQLSTLLPNKLVRYHGVGLGQYFSEEETRAILVARLISLSRGFSGVSFALLESLHALISKDVLPLIPEEGSVGASGDLTPLSYVAAVLCGDRQARWAGSVLPANEALQAAELKPCKLRPKEGLALMNGTAVMTAIACLNYARAEYLSQVCSRVTALVVLALEGNAGHFDEDLFNVKPFSGMGAVAGRIRHDLQQADHTLKHAGTLQDRYSIRCAPHVIGVLEDCLPWYRQFIEIELNSSNDNPIVDAGKEKIHHGGHFYGGHICHVMDSMKVLVANLADLIDRQLAVLVDSKMNAGLPANLSGATGLDAATDHGLKALQITASACTAEALKLCVPASIFSRSTESHNQDKVSLGTIAARDCRRVLELTEQVVACGLLAACQGVELRLRSQGRDPSTMAGGPGLAMAWTRKRSALVEEDRALEGDLRALIEGLRLCDPALVAASAIRVGFADQHGRQLAGK